MARNNGVRAVVILARVEGVTMNEEPEAAADWQERLNSTTEDTFQTRVRRLQGVLAERYRKWSQAQAREQARLVAGLRRFGAKFVQTAELVGWAPTAVVCAILAAGLAGVAVTWLAFEFLLDFSLRTARIVVGTSSLLAAVLLLVWFASNPRVSSTVRRFLLFVKFVVVVAGLVALWLAFNEVFGYFINEGVVI